MGELLFVTGGARSGKSAFAEALAARSERTVVYIATLEARDEEMRDRIAHHRARRPPQWRTIEAPLHLVDAARSAGGDACVLVDCLSVWVSNRLLPLGDEPEVASLAALERDLEREIAALIEAAGERSAPTIVVSNEVGSGVVPPYPLGRAYRDLLGRANQHVSRGADRAWLVVAGRALELPPPG